VGITQAEQAATELFRTVEGLQNPYPLYKRIREAAPVHYSDTARAWLLSRYDDCYSALRDPRIGKDFAERLDVTRPWWRERRSLTRFENSMLNIDGPEHTRLRRMVSKVFTFRSIEKLKPAIERMVDELIEPLADAGGGDIVNDLAFPLPVKVIGELLGVPPEDRAQFRQLVLDVTKVFEPNVHREDFDVADESTRIIDEYFLALIAEKRTHPTDDLLSRLANSEDDDRLDDEELITLATLLFAAGFETTTNLVGNGMVGFLLHPEQMNTLRDRPDLCGQLPFEILRYDGTVQMVIRQTKDVYEVGGATIQPGQSVLLMVAGGNHDPERYDDPDSLDVTRTDIKPLSFGGGIHFCLGAALATAEIEIVFRKLFERFKVIEPDGDIPPHRDRLTLRGMATLPLMMQTHGRASPSLPSPAQAPPRRVRTAARAPVRGLSGNGDLGPRPATDDTAWRAAFRSRVEASPGALGRDLDATVALLGRVPLFSACAPAELERLAHTAYPLSFDPGDVLCSEGADAAECYVIAEGEATVSIGDQVVATVRADDVVGEKGPIEGRPRAATVTAATQMITYAVSRDHLLALMESSPAAAAAMRDLVTERYGAVSATT
jgi:cytochrome P450